ncbi:MAG: flagellar biosynthesis protein FlhB [Beijerinckiaceae bacterium]|jgi:flagellar biosynthetic protein FlhB|nr:flagellar biosynthesis protein FlhB [Beijerinckiaceae bacterium]
MAGESDQEDKTEEPTERRIEQSIERGEVPKSMEAATFLVLAAGTLALMITGMMGLSGFVAGMRGYLENAHQVSMNQSGLLGVFAHSSRTMVGVLALPFIFAVIAGIASGLIMHKPLWTTEPMMPKFNRISPMAGFKRLFGKEALVQFVKSLLKFVIVGSLLFYVLWPERQRLGTLVQLEPAHMLGVIWSLTLKLLAGVLAIYAFVAAADILYQRFTWRQRLKMTREELKQEFKETEGSPEIKAKVRKIRAERLRQRMMAAVPKASVIITNPTHFAVALQYEAGMNAPVLVAKGLDLVALKIREIATANEIAIVENPPLARALHAQVEIDEEIPEEHYKAVAEVIGYVMRLRRNRF